MCCGGVLYVRAVDFVVGRREVYCVIWHCVVW